MAYNREPFTLEENEMALLYDMLIARILQAERDGIGADEPSSIFRKALLDKITNAFIWSKTDPIQVSASKLPSPTRWQEDYEQLVQVAELYVDAFGEDEMLTATEALRLTMVRDAIARWRKEPLPH